MENFPKEKIGLLLRKLVRECLKEFSWNSVEWEKIEEVKRLTLPGVSLVSVLSRGCNRYIRLEAVCS